jgi:hypothetical protein
MGFLRIWGWLIVVFTVIGFIIGLHEAAVLSNGVIAVISILGLLGGLYIGYLGPKIEDLESNPNLGGTLEGLEKRIQTLEGRLNTKESLELGVVVRTKEERAELEKRAREELAELEKKYTRMKPYLSEDGERMYGTEIKEAEQKVKALSQQPNSENKFCPKCGTRMAKSNAFCLSCGAPLN